MIKNDFSRVMVISPTESFLTRSFFEKLREKEMLPVDMRPTVNAVSDYNGDVDVIVLFPSGDMMDDMTFLVFIKDYAIGRDIPIFIIGKPEDVAKIERICSKDVLKGTFMRPVDINDVVTAIGKYLQFFKSADRKVLLIIDDSGAALRNAKGMFEDKYQVVLASSAMMAMKCIALHRPDLVLLDYDMPIIDGRQILEMIRSEPEFSSIPVMFLTGADDVKSVTSVMKLNPAAYLLKSRPAAEIIETVDGFFEKQRGEAY